MPFNYITLTSTTTARIQVPGYMMDKTSAVYLSSNSVIPPGPTTIIDDFFTINSHVSSLFPVATGYNYPDFNIIDANHLTLKVYGLTGSGYIDVLFYNAAGYTKLSDRDHQIVLFSGIPIVVETGAFLITEDDSPIIIE
jgi:hypothetical protein